MIVKIDKLSHDFRGICKINDKVTFVDNVLSNEVVDIKITDIKKKINIAKVVSYVETSSDRVVPLCPYYGLCGGCDISHISYNKSLEYKVDIVKNIMMRYADVLVEPKILFDNNVLGYRNKISLKIKDGKLALVEKHNTNLINISRCYLVNDNINKVIELINEIDLNDVSEVVIKGNCELMVIVTGNISSDILISVLKNFVNSIILNNKVIYGSEYITIKVKEFDYAIYPKSFFQINTNMIEKMYDKVLEYAGSGNKLLDLYCGAGTIGIYLAKNFKEVYGVEVVKQAIEGAKLNKNINNINNIYFDCKKASDIIITGADVVVVDPPRAGLDNITISKLLSSNAKKIIYVSCNPITLARDIKLLKDRYEIKDMCLFDMFPSTKHVECVIKLRLKK